MDPPAQDIQGVQQDGCVYTDCGKLFIIWFSEAMDPPAQNIQGDR